ncbi:MAG: D-2-hydroxyacid dehydrogenase [Armatimonadota bacterium]
MNIWTNHDLEPEKLQWLRDQLAPHTLVVANSTGTNLSVAARDESCTKSDIAFGQPAVEDLLATNTLKWIHITSAGFTRYDRADLRDALAANQTTFTNSSSVYDDPCAQHVFAMMICHNRRFIQSLKSHENHEWTYDALRPIERVLTGENVLIVGFGAIGVRLTELLAPFGCNVRGVRRTPNGDEAVPTFKISDLESHLGWADHVVNLLPAGPSTNKLFNERVYSQFQPNTAFYNVGRGDTVDQEALASALNNGKIAAAYLDVTSPEPLPSDHPLWSAKNCFITPHVAGGMQNEMDCLVDHFLENFKRFTAKEPLKDIVTTLGK